MLQQIFKDPIARWLTFSFVLLALIAVGLALGSIGLVQFTNDTFSQVTTRMTTAGLSAQIRSESLYLTELARRYTSQITDETDLRSRISAQQTKLNTLIEQAIDATDPGDVDERVALSRAREYIIAFNAQANQVLTVFDAEGALGPSMQHELAVLVQNYQHPLVQALLDFEQYELSQVQRAQARTHRAVQTTIRMLISLVVIVISGLMVYRELRTEIAKREQAQATIIEHQRALATLEEQERLCRELHDGLGQVLSYLNVQAQTVETMLAAGQVMPAQANLRRIVQTAQKAHADIRNFILGLRTEDAPRQDFWDALRDYLHQFHTTYGIETLTRTNWWPGYALFCGVLAPANRPWRPPGG